MAETYTFRNPICKYGHDKRVTGAFKNWGCRECHRLNIWSTDARPIPRKHCRNGHDLKMYGSKSHGCNKCASNRWMNENWSKYGIVRGDGSRFTHIDYDRAYQIQGGKCAICEIHQSEQKHRLHVDHNHKTGQFRGLLCFTCNAALGNIKENQKIIKRIGEYLQTHCEEVEKSPLI
ncbi:MAG: endonuclease VII domain-containing protein [Patescibacteria group bacterium]|nr:endonuclease VII domain-containing protein [Patescibacteria group bacterium]